jgi:predicted nucleic acid-binding protein
MILDSTFLVDFEREKKRQTHGAAAKFLQAHSKTRFCLTFTIIGELAAGQSLGADRIAWLQFIQPFRVIESSPEIAWEFGVAFRALQSQGNLIGANDLWIGAAGIALHLPVVTRNVHDFERIPKLEVVRY